MKHKDTLSKNYAEKSFVFRLIPFYPINHIHQTLY